MHLTSPSIRPPRQEPSVSARDSEREQLLESVGRVRRFSKTICEPLEIEDYVVQAMPDASPTKWHLAHTTWFFEAMVLERFRRDYRPFHPAYNYLFNSYYNSIGPRHCRPRRGIITRPTVKEIHAYRAYVDRELASCITAVAEKDLAELSRLITLGLHHEQQHQELILTDIKALFAANPLRPAYGSHGGDASASDRETVVEETDSAGTGKVSKAAPLRWIEFAGGLKKVGHKGEGFSYDNEQPRHRVWLEEYALASRLITNAEYLDFVNDGGYRNPLLWLSDGWALVQQEGWQAPLYWEESDNHFSEMTPAGMRPLDPTSPVTHVSYFEADAFARWADARLATEAEWESAADNLAIEGNFADEGRFHPLPADHGPGLQQMFGDVWEWTSSPYVGYPGYTPEPGALGEYNGKFMCNQFVLRGGSCATSRSHIRRTYRNFFSPAARWQFSGIRLAKDGK